MAVQSIDRAFQVLKALAVEPSGVTDLASRVGLPKSTVARMLSSLEDQGAVTRGPDGTSYAIGIGLVELAGAIDATAALATAVRPHLVWLSGQLGEAAGFSVPTGYTIQYMVQVESPNPVQVRDYTGLMVPMHIGPSGLSVMAQWPPEEVDRYLSRPLEAYTAHTVVDAGEIRDQVGGDQGLGPLLDPRGIRRGDQLRGRSGAGRREPSPRRHPRPWPRLQVPCRWGRRLHRLSRDGCRGPFLQSLRLTHRCDRSLGAWPRTPLP